MQEKLVEGDPEQGDVYSSGTGAHLGNIEAQEFAFVENSLHLQVLHNGKWYCYQLVSIEEYKGENDVSRTD